MVSRRKILNRSRDDLNMDQEEEDIWFSKEKLYKVSGTMSSKMMIRLLRQRWSFCEFLKISSIFNCNGFLKFKLFKAIYL